jgi:hypothetical protein
MDTGGLVLRLEPTIGEMPLSTLGETYEQIYKDLTTRSPY